MDLSIPILLLYMSTAIVAVTLIKRYTLPYFKFFVSYAIVVVVFEYIVQLAYFYGYQTKDIYNIYTFFEYNIVALIYFKLTVELASHKWIKYLMVLFNLIYILSFILTDKIKPSLLRVNI